MRDESAYVIRGSDLNYSEFFTKLSGTDRLTPMCWQQELVETTACEDRLIRIPTGFGKTLGVLTAWLWHRVHRNDDAWPRRLIWCLPMRVLVEQTEAAARLSLQQLGTLWEGGDHEGRIGVHALMGGADSGDWHLHPEQCAVLIGTQDMLLSRALNRGYGAARARWPMDFGLLNQDCLWVMDEVQLMDVGLATSGQIHAFRDEDRRGGKAPRPCHTWWMSATLQRSWLEKSPEARSFSGGLSMTEIALSGRSGHLWDDVHKPVVLQSAQGPKDIAASVAAAHLAHGRGSDGPTLVVLNRVEDAVNVHELLNDDKRLRGTDLRLVHSRFRPHERASWREDFLNRRACSAGTDRIIVATQVVEAGVDLSAAVLVTALAPWTSLVQRFGRAARWGGSATIIVIDTSPQDDKAAAPYSKDELDAAREALGKVSDVAPLHLEGFEESNAGMLGRLYPYSPKQLLLRHEMDELFDTTPDLSGADVDISRFIRSGEERDLQVFWHDIPKSDQPFRKLRPSREALCAVPFLRARDWLCGKETASAKAPRLKKGMRAWVWDWIDGAWRRLERRDLYPGQTVLVASECGGYEPSTGWSPQSARSVEPIPDAVAQPDDLADASQDDETLSEYPWQTIAVHGGAVGQLASLIASALLDGKASLFDLAGRWHDAGKAHVAFQNSIVAANRPNRGDLAKAPDEAWLPVSRRYPDADGKRRGGFRHELASTLALFDVLQRHQPDHPALLGPWRSLLEAVGMPPAKWDPPGAPPTTLEAEIIQLSAEDFDLLAYLVCAHHGKVRVAWHACAADQEAVDDRLRIRGIRDGEMMPAMLLSASDGTYADLPPSRLNLAAAAVGLNPLTGRGWTERVLGLLQRFGPFTLAWFEALLRAADQRASRERISDPLLAKESQR